MEDDRRYELRWHHHQSTVVAEVDSLYRDAALVDVTLACEDQRTYQAHKLVLSACSHYFQSLFARHHNYQHPIIFLKDVSGDECEALLSFMYRGEVSVAHDQFKRIIHVANSLQIRGLAEMDTSSSRPSSPAGGDHRASSPPPSPSTGPPTKCATPLSEPPISPPSNSSHSVNHSRHQQPPDPPLEHTPDPPPSDCSIRHPALAAAALAATTLPQYPPPPLPHHHGYNPYSSPLPPHPSHSVTRPSYHDHLASTSLIGSCIDDLKRPLPPDIDDPKLPPSLPSPYLPLSVKRDLGGATSWDGGGPVPHGMDLDPGLPSVDHPPGLTHRTNPYIPHLFNMMNSGGPPVDHHSPPEPPPFGLPWNGMFKGLPPRSLPHPPLVSDKGRFSIVDPIIRGNETRSHKCHFCSRKFKRKDHLKTHIRIHTGERPYKCKICNRGFIQSQQVKIHMKVHVREDSTGLGPSSGLCGPGGLIGGGVGEGGSSHHMPPLFPTYSDHNSRAPSHHSSDSHTDLDPHMSTMNLDSENECSSEIAETEYDMRPDLANPGDRTPPRPSTSSTTINNGNNNGSHPSGVPNSNSSTTCVTGSLTINNKLAKISPPSPSPPAVLSSASSPTCFTNASPQQSSTHQSSGHQSSGYPSSQGRLSSYSMDDRNAVLKEAFHIGAANLKK